MFAFARVLLIISCQVQTVAHGSDMLFYVDSIFFVPKLKVHGIHDVFSHIFWIKADTMPPEYLQNGV